MLDFWTLIAGLPATPDSLSPRIGRLRKVVVPVTTSLANGQIGFTSVETIYVQEPVSKPLQVRCLCMKQ